MLLVCGYGLGIERCDFKHEDRNAASISPAQPLGILCVVVRLELRNWRSDSAYQPPRLLIFLYVDGFVQVVDGVLPTPVLGVFELFKRVLRDEAAGTEETPAGSSGLVPAAGTLGQCSRLDALTYSKVSSS
jgi:hypothetical protein